MSVNLPTDTPALGNLVIDPPVIPTPHPNSFVAIATARIAHKETLDVTRVNTGLVTSVSGRNTRFILVLDALASLAISNLKGQVVAMAIQIENGLAAITISENREVKEGLAAYIQGLVEMLKGISKATEEERPAKELEFYKATYIYSFIKLHKRFTNRDWLAPFDVEFAKKNGAEELKCQVVLSALLTAWDSINKIKIVHAAKTAAPNNKKKKFNLETAVTDNEWTELMFMMSTSIPDVEYLLNHPTLCDNWAEELQGTVSVPSIGVGNILPVPLFRAIEKLTSHHRHILLLFAYATSVDGRKDLDSYLKILVRPMEKTPPIVVVPNIPGVESALRPFMPKGMNLDTEVDLIKSSMQTQLGIVLDEDNPTSFEGIVHCECALIAKFNEAPHPPGPMTYIGVSKLSCAACYAWIQAFNATHKTKYQTRGCHGRWYPKWAMPAAPVNMTAQEEEVEKSMHAAMSKIVGEAYRKFYDAGAATRAILMSDSSDSKARLPGIEWNIAELQKAVRLSKEKRLERATNASNANKKPPTA